MFYEGIVVENSSPDDSDRIEVQSVRLSQKFKTAFTDKNTEINIGELENMDVNVKLGASAKVKVKTTFTAYPLDFAGSQTNGRNLYPEIGDTVFLTFLDDDETQLYYMLGSKKIERQAKDKNPTSLKIDFLDVIGIPTGDIPSKDRRFFKVIFKTLANNSLTFIDRLKDFGILLRSKANFIHIAQNDSANHIHMKTGGNFFVKIDEKAGIITIKTAAGNFINLVDEGNTINISSNNVINLTSTNNINLTSKNINLTAEVAINLNSDVDINIGAKNISSTASGELKIKSANTTIEASGAAMVTAETVNLNSTDTTIEASGTATVTAGTINLN